MKQKTALSILKAGRNVYLTGAAGSGKTYVLNQYIEYLKNRGVAVAVTASTGIASTHIGGMTIHSWSGLGIRDSLTEMQIETLTQKERLWKRYDKTKVLIIDEVSMLSPALFDTLEKVCRVMKRNEEPFGGMQIVLSGDFFQLPPISRSGGSSEFIDASDAWNNMDIRICYLDEQFRQEDGTLENILNDMRTGNVSQETRDALDSRKDKKIDGALTPTKIYTHNMDVDKQNEKELEKINGKEFSYEMESRGNKNVTDALKKGILAPETLKLKMDAVVMFIKNSPEGGFVNGTVGIVESFDGDIPVVRIRSGKKIYVTASEWVIEENGKILGSVEQLPLRLAWAITIHKSQGMSMDVAEIDLSKTFVAGQGYVALSRLKTLSGLVLRGINEMAFAVNSGVANLDKYLLSESAKWEKVLQRFDESAMSIMHDEFIKKSGGTVDKKEIEKNKKKEIASIEEKISSPDITRGLLEKGMSLENIAKERGMVIGTIISHVEKLAEIDDELVEKFKPKDKDLKIIKRAFKKTGDTKLSPVYNELKGKYSYEDLRVARIFI